MPTIIWATTAFLSICSTVTAEILEERQIANGKVSSTAFPTVPSFTQASVTYGAFSKVYPSGYTVPSGATNTATATPSASTNTRRGGDAASSSYEAEVSHADYLSSMCFPTITKYDKAKSTSGVVPDTKFPCHAKEQAFTSCETPQKGEKSVSPKDQHACYCGAGAGEAYWTYTEACENCLHLHGASADDSFLPVQFIKNISSAYCGMKTASVDFYNFVGNFSKTHPPVYGKQTGGVDLLKGKTAISNYFTSSTIAANSTSMANSTSSAGSTGSSRTVARATAAVPTTTASSRPSSASPSATSTSGSGRIVASLALCSMVVLGLMWPV